MDNSELSNVSLCNADKQLWRIAMGGHLPSALVEGQGFDPVVFDKVWRWMFENRRRSVLALHVMRILCLDEARSASGTVGSRIGYGMRAALRLYKSIGPLDSSKGCLAPPLGRMASPRPSGAQGGATQQGGLPPPPLQGIS